jgi:hypothetical protein
MNERDKAFVRVEAAYDQVWAEAEARLSDIQRVAFALTRGDPLSAEDLELARRVMFLAAGEIHRRISLRYVDDPTGEASA